MPQTILLLLILGLRPEWQPGICDRPFANEANKTYCENRQEEGYAKAEQYALWMAEEAERFDLPLEIMPVVAYQEQSLSFSDECVRGIQVSRIQSREIVNEEQNRWQICWTYGDQDRRTCQPVIVLEEQTEMLVVDRCAYGEVGGYQLMMREIPAGYELPWGETIGRSTGARRRAALDPRTNIHLGARALAEVRTMCCSDDGGPVDQECAADWKRWIGGHNTGRCRGDSFDRYAATMQRHIDEALVYACAQDPTLPLCPTVPE